VSGESLFYIPSCSDAGDDMKVLARENSVFLSIPSYPTHNIGQNYHFRYYAQVPAICGEQGRRG
jgi:hypothetical protein